MPPSFFNVLILPVLVSIPCMISYAVLHEWRFQQLRWRHLTAHNCRRYLVPKGWRDGGGESALRLDKGPFSINIICIQADPATVRAVQMGVTDLATPGRLSVVLVPGVIGQGVAEVMMASQVLVLCYRRLVGLDVILRATQASLAASYAAEHRSRTQAAYEPTPATLLAPHEPPATPAPPAPATPAIPARPELIASTEQVQATLRDYGSDTLVIAFNDTWHLGESGHLRCGPATQNPGFSIIDVATRTPNWFPADDMAALLPAILARVEGRFPRRVMFGFSQGGYGAIKFSRALHATTVVAFSPQISIDPRAVGQGRFASQFDFNRNAGMAITANDSAGQTYVFYDPYDEQDTLHAARIGKLISTNDIKLPFFGLSTYRLFSTPESLRLILQLCQANDTPALMRLAAGQRQANRARPLLMAMHLATHRPAVAIRICNAYARTWTEGNLVALYYRLAVNGSATVVLPMIEALAATHPDHPEVQGGAALVAIRAKCPEAAHKFVTRARTIDPNNEKWRQVEANARKLLLNA